MRADGGVLSFPHAAPPLAGSIIDVAPGLRWLRMPLPFALDHINLWLIEDGDGWAIIDTGFADERTRELWRHILATALQGQKVTRLIVTHYHPDHMGLAGWLAELLGVELWATQTEWLVARMMSLDDTAGYVTNAEEYYRRVGFDEATRMIFAEGGNPYPKSVSSIPRRFHRLTDGMALSLGSRQWRVIVGRGHAPEHACLYCPELDLLITGDQVLPKISPNVGVWPQEPETDALGDYLTSLRKLREIVPSSALALPSHNLPFRGLHRRIDQLASHHAERLVAAETACTSPRSVLEIVPTLFCRELDLHQLRFAVGETLAHLHHAVGNNRLVRSERDDGVWLFARA